MNITAIIPRLQMAKETSPGHWQARCPAHDDKNPSLAVSVGDKGGIVLHCHAGCTPDAVCSALGLTLADLFPPKNARNGHAAKTLQLVNTYDYTNERGELIFQVCRFDPKTFKQRRPDTAKPGEWIWNTKGVEKVLFRLPEILADIQNNKFIFLVEGEKDALTMAELGISATTNPGGASKPGGTKWLPQFNETLRGVDVVIIPDRDKPGREHAANVATNLYGKAKSVRILELPDVNGQPVKDAADFFNAGGNAGQIGELVDRTPEWTPDNSDRLTLRTPDEILAMQFDDSDRILGDRILASGQSLVISGQGGIGKSRLLLQMAVACRAGLPFIGLETRGQELRWLVLQAENSCRRLKADLEALRRWVGAEHWRQVNAGLSIHTLESDADGFLSVSNTKAQLAIKAAVESSKPDIVAFDSLYNFGAGNLNSDEDMAETLLTLSRLAKAGNPKRAIVILHHAGTGKAGAAKAIGFDRSSFGRNSKVLHSWCRAQVNIAPGSPDDDGVFVLTCGKCSNGKEFPMFAARLDPDTMIYNPDETFDLSGWQADVTGKRTEQDLSPARVAEIVAELCKTSGAPKKPAIVKALRDETGCATSGAYKAVDRAEHAKAIHYTKATKTYVAS
jgi:hypothetical protein